ncbi:AAA family ATPase [Streptomyces sp. NPDC006289]|uniref:AAA family ATPase n=1 Tax=Streptomyces sp. NPDC006289 TaxID=3156744 RepID=UPI0033B522FF
MPLYDRTSGLAALHSATARVRDGATVQMAVTGPPGTGRSFLLDTIGDLVEKDGFVVRRARGSRLDQGLGLDLARRLLPGDALEGDATRADVVRAVVTAEQAPHTAPVAVLLDDLQWADEESLARLARLSAGQESAPLLLVYAVCEGEAASGRPALRPLLDAADTVVRTGPLGNGGVRALLRERGALLTDAQARAWTRATGGNPALIVSLLERLREPQRLAPETLLAVARSHDAPWSLRARVSAALSGLPEDVRHFAHCAALLGGAPEAGLLARLARLDTGEAEAAEGALRRLGWAPGRGLPPVLWDCVREIADDGMPLDRRAELHRAAAELLHEAGAPAERITPHLLEIGPGEWSGAPWVLRAAADSARRRGDSVSAIRYLRRALREFLPDSPERGEFLAALARAEQDTDVPAMLRHVRQAIPLLRSVRERREVVGSMPLALFVSARHVASEALDSVREPDGAVTSGTEPEELRLRLEARALLFGAGGGAAPADEIGRLPALRHLPDPGTAAQRELAVVHVFAGTLGGGLPAVDAAGLVCRLLEHEPVAGTTGYGATALLIASGIAAEAHGPVRAWLDAALEAARRRGDERQRIRILGWRALAALHSGRVTEAWSDALEACTAEPGTLGDDDWLSLLGLASVAAATNAPWQADRLRILLRAQPETGMPLRDLALKVMDAPSASEDALPEMVREILAAAQQGEAEGWCNQTLFPVDLICVPLLLRVAEPEVALELLARSCDRARAFGSPTALGRVLRLWGTVVRGRYALSLLAEAVAVLRESANTLELGRSLTAYGTRLRAAGRPGGDELLAEADRIADEMGVPVLHCWSRALGAHKHGAVPPGSGRLTDTERRVAAMVALGHTSQEAAEALGVTRRAVEKTLTRLYRRLDVAGRAELIPVVRRMAGAAAFSSGALSTKL